MTSNRPEIYLQLTPLRPPAKGFICKETTTLQVIEDDDDNNEEGHQERKKIVLFQCIFPTTTTSNNDGSGSHSEKNELLFHCRDPSVGFLIKEEQSAAKEEEEDEEEEYQMDPNFFDPGYTLAGKTGFQIWAGSRLVLEALTIPQATNDPAKLKQYQSLQGKRILELGSGVGVVGVSLASRGAQVLLTDLSTLVEHSIRPNLVRNRNKPNDDETTTTNSNKMCPEWLVAEDSQSVPIGDGWAGAIALDWTVPLETQLSTNTTIQQLDMIIASDCVWLLSMLNPLLDTVQSVFEQQLQQQKQQSPPPSLLLSFQRRDPKDGSGDESAMFTSVNRICQEIIHHRGWHLECLTRQYAHTPQGTKEEVFLLEITRR